MKTRDLQLISELDKCFQVDFDYIYDSEGLSVDIFSPHKAVTKTKGK